ncbi:hypothetical protein L2E82_22859 [Cichorium intybus]|uniref:Uncharacterized protein n=1 Tax=Cichorium intybus TaxID=13427 RepID=A0ACB9DZB8_CICIN|nr:hypothetical protein L2E82_22859 [Cichorium intybus]
MGLYSHLYAKVFVISKVLLPNYRFDLDDKRPQREVALPQGLQRKVEAHLKEYIAYKAKTVKGSQDNLILRTSTNGSINNDEGLFEQPELSSQSKAAIEKLLWRRSVQLLTQEKDWEESSDGWRMLQLRKNLPVYKEKDAILNAVSQNQIFHRMQAHPLFKRASGFSEPVVTKSQEFTKFRSKRLSTSKTSCEFPINTMLLVFQNHDIMKEKIGIHGNGEGVDPSSTIIQKRKICNKKLSCGFGNIRLGYKHLSQILGLC